jgi:hypothetical protein
MIVTWFVFRLLSHDKRDGAFILWDDDGEEKQILSFVSGNLVCHVYLLETESGIEVGEFEFATGFLRKYKIIH